MPDSRAYAALANDAYTDRRVGQNLAGHEKPVVLAGVKYDILEHADNPRTGYQGTVYRSQQDGAIVVAHRGTEQIFKDGVLADGGMVLTRNNLQVPDAIALTERAMGYARKIGEEEGKAPQVSVTGHSLGGTLAQVSAHRFDLKGETFNAYGAVSLNQRIPEIDGKVTNHVMAADAVSAGSPHFGKVQIYATQKEIDTLYQSGFREAGWAQALMPDSPILAAARSLGSHKMSQFVGEQSVLERPQALALAKANAGLIEDYREKVGELRERITEGSRGLPGKVIDTIDTLRGPAAPGAGLRSAVQHDTPASLLMSNPDHPGNALFAQAQQGVHGNDARVGRSPDQMSDQLAGCLASRMHAAGGQRIDAVLLSKDASHTFAVQGNPDDAAHLRVAVQTTTAMHTPLEHSSQQLLAQSQQANSQTLAHSHAQQAEQQANPVRHMG
jgi:hypothetical protein